MLSAGEEFASAYAFPEPFPAVDSAVIVATPAATATATATAAASATVSLRAAADAYVRDGSYAGQNFGQGAVLEVKRSTAGYDRESYLRFDLTGVTSAAAVTSAKVRLFGKLHAATVPSIGVGLHPVAGTTWSESALTYKSRPAASAKPVLTRTVSGTAGKWYEYDVTSYLKQQKAAGATRVAFALRGTIVGAGWADFASDENPATANRPQLVVMQSVAATVPTLAGLTLMNAATDRAIGPLANYPTIDLNALGRELTVRAEPGANAASVRFTLDGKAVRVENTVPWALAGDASGDLLPWAPVLGTHTLTVTPYSAANAGGTAGKPLTATFTVVEGPKLAGLTLVDANADLPVGPLVDGQTVDLFTAGPLLSVRADLGEKAVSVVFNLDGVVVATESGAPHAMLGDASGDYNAWAPTPGAHTLTVTPYSAAKGTGLAGAPLTVRFTVVDSGPAGDTLDARAARATTFAERQLRATLALLDGATTAYPRVTSPDGRTWVTKPPTDWAAGFFPASLWATYARTGDAFWRDAATASANGMRGNVNLPDDVTFTAYLPFAPLLAQTSDPAVRQILLKAAASKAATWNDTVGAFESGYGNDEGSHSGNPRANFGVLFDHLMDAQLLLWAAEQPGGDPAYRDKVIRHADTVIQHMVRPNGGSVHFGFFDKANGEFISAETAQGYADDSTWARGQAWGVYAYTLLYRETGEARFLATARRLADYFLAHLPADRVPYWDFGAPVTATTPKDSSAGAIVASALFDLAGVAPDAADRAKYGQSARDLLGALLAPPYYAEGTGSRGILNRGAWFVPDPVHYPESATSWGDYYLIEALDRFEAATAEPVQAVAEPVVPWLARLGG